jgi:hypothetical protein
MNEYIKATIADALRDAHRPAAVVSEQLFAPPDINELGDLPTGPDGRHLLAAVLQANALRDTAHRQTVLALSAMADPKNLDWSRLAPTAGTTPRKPRIELWAELNERNTLDILWQPQRDAAPEDTVSWAEWLTQSDYRCLESTWPYHHARLNVVFRALAREYGVPASGAARPGRGPGARILREALTDSLAHLVNALGAVCDVTIGTWPAYVRGGTLVLESPAERACECLSRREPDVTARRRKLQDSIINKLRKLELSGLPEFETLLAQAARDNVKVTALIFAKTGKRSTSLETDKLAADVVAMYQAMQTEEALRAAQAHLRLR